MDSVLDSERFIFKILNGIQSGVEVALAPGDYSVGSGEDDDIQLVDVTLKPRHLRIRVAPGKIEIAAQDGSYQTLSGLRGDAGDTQWQELEPLNVVTAGTIRFALGLQTAQWATVTDDDGHSARPTAIASDSAAGGNWQGKWRLFAWPVAGVAFALLLGSAAFMTASSGRLLSPTRENDLEVVQAAIAPFPFVQGLTLRQEVDGTIYAQGYVESLVERRAVAEAIERTGVPARVRLYVLQVLRSEIDALIKAEKVNVTYRVAPDGAVSVEGTILQPAGAERFITRLRENAVGMARLDSRIRTAETFLEDMEKLKTNLALDQQVFLRLDREVIEANGVVSTNKVDAWVGFLQTYSRRFGKDIGLRSFVQLQNDPATPLSKKVASSSSEPLVFGPQARADSGSTLDLERLQRGDFDPGSLFAGVRDAATPASGDASRSREAARDDKVAGPGTSPADPRSTTKPDTSLKAPIQPRTTIGTTSFAAQENGTREASDPAEPQALPSELRSQADRYLRNWLDRAVPGTEEEKGIQRAIETLAKEALGQQKDAGPIGDASRQQFAHAYEPLLASSRSASSDQCRQGSRLTSASVGPALFWLDVLSSTDSITLDRFSPQEQGQILEAALDPGTVRRCLAQDQSGRDALTASVYLAEASRNPDFVQFVTRTLPNFDLSITGVSVLEPRFVQTASGEKMREGAAPSDSSRIDVIGELGIAIQQPKGFSRVLYGASINWLSSAAR